MHRKLLSSTVPRSTLESSLVEQSHYRESQFSPPLLLIGSVSLSHNQPHMQERTDVFIFTKPSDSHTYFIRGHSVSLSRLQVISLITSDTASCVFMRVYLQYAPGGLSRESEVQRPPARMLNQY